MSRLEVRRVLTDTPLARRHERAMAQREPRRGVEIPWASFDRSLYPEPALKLAAEAQRALALGEYGAVDLFSRLASGLALAGAPFDLVAAATRVPADEIRHSDYALRMASLLAGEPASVTLDSAAFEGRFPARVTLEILDGWMLEVAAIEETLAGALLGACRDRATDPVLRAMFTTIVADEVHHARLGWYYLAWRAPLWTLAERQRVADRAGELVMQVERRFAWGRDAPKGARKAARALGVLETAGQRQTVRRVVEDEIVPALDALGLGASYAWRARTPLDAA